MKFGMMGVLGDSRSEAVLMNFGPLFRGAQTFDLGAKIFDQGYLTYFLTDRDESWVG